MGLIVKNVYNVNGRWKFRKVVPPQHRQHIQGNLTEFVRWLGPVNQDNSTLLEKVAAAQREYDGLIEHAKKRETGIFDPLTDEQIAIIIEEQRHILLEEDEEERFDDEEDKLYQSIFDQLTQRGIKVQHKGEERRWRKRNETIEWVLPELRKCYAQGKISPVITDELDDVISSYQLNLDKSSTSYKRLARAYLSLQIEVLELLEKRQRGEVVITPPPSRVFDHQPVKAQPVDVQEDRTTIRQMAEKKLASEKRGHSTTEATETALRLFESVYGSKPMASITRREVSEWIELLQQKPTRPERKHRNLSLPKMVEVYRDKPSVPRLSGKSINGHVGQLNAVWMWARKKGFIDRQLDNPFSEQRVPERLPALSEGFTTSQLQAIFDLPIFTKGERPKQGRGDACYWLPLLLLTYGTRPEEMCQLLVSDVFQDEESKRWYIQITDEGNHPVKGPRHIKADGNPVVRRALPVTKLLVKLGFVHYVEHLKKKRIEALFPLLTTKGNRGYLYESISTWWGKYLREHGAIPETGNKPLRGFRDAWTTAAARSGLTEEEREWIQGHYVSKGKTSNRLYGVRDFGAKVEDVQYRGIDLSKVIPWKSP